MKPSTEISMQLYEMMLERGYPENLCDLVTRNLNTDYTATRMIGYLSHYSYLPVVEVVDEMLAILSDRNAIMKKKESEQAQAKINKIYRFGLDIEQGTAKRTLEDDMRFEESFEKMIRKAMGDYAI